MDPLATRGCPGGHGLPGPLHRGPRRRTVRARRRPVRPARGGPRHLRPAPTRDRLTDNGLRGRPACAQAWKQHRLVELGFEVPDWLRLVPVDFETDSWWDRLLANGFDVTKPAVVASAGVSMYLSRDATAATLRQIASLAAGSTLAMTFLRPLELVEADELAAHQATDRCRAGVRAHRSSATTPHRRSLQWRATPAFPPRRR